MALAKTSIDRFSMTVPTKCGSDTVIKMGPFKLDNGTAIDMTAPTEITLYLYAPTQQHSDGGSLGQMTKTGGGLTGNADGTVDVMINQLPNLLPTGLQTGSFSGLLETLVGGASQTIAAGNISITFP